MTITTAHPGATTSGPTVEPAARLLRCGVVAGPVFLTAGLIQAFTRPGFDFDQHALSMLSLGSLGFIQIANFLVTGIALVLAGLGMRRALATGPGHVWGPRLVAGFGTGMIMAGLFRADPAYGFPAGAPAGPGEFSWHGALHAAGFAVAMISWITVTVVFARHFASTGERAWSRGCVAAPAAALILGASPLAGSFGVRIVVVSAVQFALIAALSVKLIRAGHTA